MSNKTIGATIDEELNIQLERYMKEEDRTKAQVVRMALNEFFDGERNKPVIAYALAEVIVQVNKLQREYGEIIPKEDMAVLNEKLAIVLAAEGS